MEATHVNQVVVGGVFGGVEGLGLLGPAGCPQWPLLGCGATGTVVTSTSVCFSTTFEAETPRRSLRSSKKGWVSAPTFDLCADGGAYASLTPDV